MFDKKRQYSYKEQKKQRYRLLKFIFFFIFMYVVYNLVVTFYFSVWVLDNENMQPGLSAGDRIIFTSFGMGKPELAASAAGADPAASADQINFKRGSIVLVDIDDFKDRHISLKLLDGVVRFFTAQRLTIFSGEGQYYLKRVIGLPGDEISMNNFIFRVRPAGSLFSLTEFELAYRPYHPFIPQVSGLWDDSIPFSGNMEPFVLGPNDIFVVSDDRSNTNDSRTWGPVSPATISAKAVLRFWPVTRFEFF